jgi:DNA-binding response OmpR family regulator
MLPAALRLLVADHDPHTRALLALLLTAEAYRVELVASPEEAAARHAVAPADLILTDSGGGRAAGEPAVLGILAAAAGTPVLLLSARPLGREAARAAGFCDALPKPFDIDDLVGRVRAALAAAEGA